MLLAQEKHLNEDTIKASVIISMEKYNDRMKIIWSKRKQDKTFLVVFANEWCQRKQALMED